jgi:hypothetical protein
VELSDYKIAMLETSLGKVGRDSDGVVLRPTLIHKVDETGKAEIVKVFWKGRKPRRMGPAKVLDFHCAVKEV